MEIALIVSLIVLALLGLINAAYISYKRKAEQPMVCPINNDCEAVIESRWSRNFYIKNDTLGIIYYITLFIFILSLFLYTNYTILISKGLLLMNSLAFIFSLFLLYVQKYKIKSYCFYCLISALITFLVFLNTIVLVVF